jgi:DNA ligase (NAD+)
VLLERRPEGTTRYAFPEHCPACGSPVESKPGEATVRCPNFHCPVQLQHRLEHFASAAAVNIAGLGPALIGNLVRAGLVKAPVDFYRLRVGDLVRIDGVGPQRAKHLLSAIERSKRAELWRFIHGLGIPKIGAANARKLAEACGSLEAMAKMGKARIVEIAGAAVADSLEDFLARPENRADLATLGSLALAAGTANGK